MLKRVAWGVRLGLVFAAIFSTVAVALFVVSRGAVLNHSGLLLTKILLAYLAGGIASGVIFGLMLPLARWAAGWSVIGIATAFPAYLAVGAAINQPFELGSQDLKDATVLAVIVGGIGGPLLRYRLLKRGLLRSVRDA